MASNLTSRARHNSRPCSPCARPPHRPPTPFAVALSRWIVCRPVHRTRAHMRNRPTHARVYTRMYYAGQVRVRPSASKPLEVETLRKYNADGETCLFSPHPFFFLFLPRSRCLFFFRFFISFASPSTFDAYVRFFRCELTTAYRYCQPRLIHSQNNQKHTSMQ